VGEPERALVGVGPFTVTPEAAQQLTGAAAGLEAHARAALADLDRDRGHIPAARAAYLSAIEM
jgi:hypothetical protein